MQWLSADDKVTTSKERVKGSCRLNKCKYFHPQSSYDMELQALQEMIQEKVVMLLNDPDNSVKRTLLDNGITRLCVFFGRQKGEETKKNLEL